MRRTTHLLATAAATALLATACSGSAGEDGTADGGGTAAASCDLPDDAEDRGTETVDGTEVELTAGDLFFSPTCVTGLEAGTVSVTVTNDGESLHNIQVEGQDVDTDIPAGETVTVDIDLSSGSVPFVCKYHTTSGMVGELVAG